jgi:4'-phosphopantetheinyl transferase
VAARELRGMKKDDVHVWPLRLDLAPAAQARLETLLSDDELARAQRFARAADRNRYVCAHGLLRLVLARYIGLRPEDVAFGTGRGGKPRLANRRGPRFNLSHADGLGLLAVSGGREVGVDLEKVRELGHLGELARRCFSPVEQAAFAAIAEARQLRAFFAGWTRKEAFLKALGDGLSRRLDSFDVALKPGAPARLLRVQGAPRAHYALRALRPAAGYEGAVAADGRRITLRWWPWAKVAALAGIRDAEGRAPAARARRAGGRRGRVRVRTASARRHWGSDAVLIGEKEP